MLCNSFIERSYLSCKKALSSPLYILFVTFLYGRQNIVFYFLTFFCHDTVYQLYQILKLHVNIKQIYLREVIYLTLIAGIQAYKLQYFQYNIIFWHFIIRLGYAFPFSQNCCFRENRKCAPHFY